MQQGHCKETQLDLHLFSTGVCLTQQMQLKLPKKQQRPLSAALGELHVQQSSKLLNGQPTLLPGLLLELNIQQSSEMLKGQLTLLPGRLLDVCAHSMSPACLDRIKLC